MERRILGNQGEQERINKAVILFHTITDCILTLAYLLEFFKGARTLPYRL